jgi:hypothetical protein
MTDAPLPLTPDLVDELLSADLDGEFDAAARDLGLDPVEARTRLAALPAVANRRAALTRARDAFAQVPPVDELLAARLRAKATKAGDQVDPSRRAPGARRWQRTLGISGAVAAGIAIVVGITLNARSTGSDQDKATAPSALDAPSAERAAGGASSPSTAAGSARARAVDLGTFPNVATLTSHVQSVAPLAAPNASSTESSTASRSFSTKSAGTAQDLVADDAAFVHCDAVVRRFGGVTTEPVLRAVATVAGTPVAVQVFQRSTARVLVVITADCRLVDQQVLTTP